MDLPLWQKAASFAARKHQHQPRKDGRTPYIAHPFRVAMTVRDIFDCSDQVALAAALLHDTIEDTTTDFEDIADLCNHDVALCVAALTKNAALPEPEREDEYHARLKSAPWQARLVKLADQYDNVSDAFTAEAGTAAAHALPRALKHAQRALDMTSGDPHPIVSRARALLESVVREASSR